jgi:hypothetical protein
VDAAGVVPRGLDGVDRPWATRTSGWAVPRQRMNDNKWVILHPENHPFKDEIIDTQTGQKWSDYLMRDAANLVIEEELPSWFPNPVNGS